MRLCIVRHGETAWNAEHRLQGWTDIPLNAKGRAQAQALARELAGVAFDAIVSSPLARALATAEAVAGGRPIQLDARLRERHHGDLQGLTRAEIADRHPALHAALQARSPDFEPPGGETIAVFAARVQASLQELAARHAGRQLLLVAHGGVLDVAYRLATGQDLHSPRRQALPNAALNWLQARPDGRWQVEAFGLDDHLHNALDEL